MSDLSTFMRQVSRSASMLDAEEERALLTRWTKDRDRVALSRLVRSHIRLVYRIAIKYQRQSVETDDLVQVGCAALISAATKFDLDKGNRFSTYATYWVQAAMREFVLHNRKIVRGKTSHEHRLMTFRIDAERARLGRHGTLTKREIDLRIAALHHVPIAAVEHADAADVPLDAPAGDGTSRSDFLIDAGESPLEMTERALDGARRRAALRSAIGVLNDREERVIAARWLSEDGVVLATLADEFGVSKERVRQIEVQAFEKLRKALKARGITSVGQ